MAVILRRAAVIIVLIAAGALLTACGKSAHFGGAGSTAAKAGSKASARAGRVLGAAQARALVKRLNLQAGDLPGFKVSTEHEHETAAEKRLERKLLRCMGGQRSSGQASGAALAEASSKSFERRAQVFRVSVSSDVTIVRAPAQAAAELKAIRSKQAQVCLTRYLHELLANETRGGASAKLVSISEGTPSAPGTAGTYAWRITGEIAAHSLQIPFYIEMVGFVYGQEEVQLLSFGLPAPFPAAAEQALFSLLVSRAKAGGAAKAGKRGGLPKAPSPSGPRRVQISL